MEVSNIKKELEKHGAILYKNKGFSMKPFIRENKDAILIEKAESFKKFDVVLFERKNGELVLHRIVEVRKGHYYILGDNCIDKEVVYHEQILGVMTKIIRDCKIEILSSDKSYMKKVKIWYFLYPIRRFFLRAKRKIKRTFIK